MRRYFAVFLLALGGAAALAQQIDPSQIKPGALDKVSVNSQINVQALGAKGDCVTDDSAAIQAAMNAAVAYNPPATVIFPKPAGGCYLTSTIQWNGAPLLGQDPPHGFNYGAGAVVIKGKPGADIFHVVDPTTAGSVAPARSWSIRKLNLMVDNSVAGSFPHRWPGRWLSSGTMTSGSAALTAAGAQFTCGDVGQPIRVIGAGTSGADLVTTIASVSSCSAVSGGNNSATLTAAASTTVTGALVYVSVHDIPVTTTIGNAAIAFDNYDGKSSDWVMTGSIGSLGDAISDVDIDATNGNACQYLDQCPTAAAIYFQGVWAPYQMDARNINIGPGLMFGIVEGTPDTNPQSGAIGQDYQTWDTGGWHTVYPWISYNGAFNQISRIQFADQFGPAVLQVDSGTEYQANSWTIDSNPEFEQNCYYLSTAPSTCVPGIGWRIDGGSHYINMTKLASNSATAYLDSFDSIYTNMGILGALQVNGYLNKISFNSDVSTIGLTAMADNGLGNIVSGEYLASPYHSQAQTRSAAINVTRGNALVGEVDTDFLTTGNAGKPYLNNRDLLFFPDDFQWQTPGPTVVADSGSLSGRYTKVTASNYDASFSLFNVQNGNPNNQSGRAVICSSAAGCEIPASRVVVYVSAKCPSDTSFSFSVMAANTTVSNATVPCSSSYTTYPVVANFSSYSGSYLQLYFGVTTEVDVAWIGVRPTAFDMWMNTSAVSTLPAANTFNKNEIMLVSDGTSAGDCTAGGGTTQAMCVSNGTAWQPLGAATHNPQFAFSYVGSLPSNAQTYLLIPILTAVTVPASCSGSVIGAVTAPTASTTFTVAKLSGGPTGASTTLCTGTIAGAANTATFTGTGGSLAVADWLKISGAATADTTMKDIGGNIGVTY